MAAVAAGRREETRTLIKLRDAEDLGPYNARDIRRYINSGALVEGVHYTKPHGARPLVVREAYLAWLEGEDAEFRKESPKRRTGRVNWDVLNEAI